MDDALTFWRREKVELEMKWIPVGFGRAFVVV